VSLRDPYVIGRLDSYWTPTIGHVDAALILLAALLDAPVKAATPERVRSDIDRLLDRRLRLAAAERPRTKETIP
jgi:hypothetical protein